MDTAQGLPKVRGPPWPEGARRARPGGDVGVDVVQQPIEGPAGRTTRASYVVTGRVTVLALVAALWLDLLAAWTDRTGRDGLPVLLEAVRDTALVAPVAVAITALAGTVLRTRPRTCTAEGPVGMALAVAAAIAATEPVRVVLLGSGAHGRFLPTAVAVDAVTALGVCLPTAALLARLTPTAVLERLRRRRLTLRAVPAALLVTAGVQLLVPPTVTAAPTGPQGVCADATRTVRYDVVAMQVDLPLNGWGDHIPDALIFALANNDARPNADQINADPRKATPLVLRAAVGDCIVVNLRNQVTGHRVGMHVDGVAKAVTGPEASDGARIGYNDDSTVPTGATRTYIWLAQREGQFPINDYGSGTDFKRVEPSTDTTSHGLYGGLVVLPRGYTWNDPVTGRDLLAQDGPGSYHGIGAPVFADARGPQPADDFRDLALVFMDEPEGVVDGSGRAPTYPETGVTDSTFGFNYRTEPLRNRLRAVAEPRAGKTVTLPNGTVILPQDHWCDGWTNDQSAAANEARLAKDHGLSGCLGEESHLQSWPFGDEGKLTQAVDENDVLTLGGATGGSFTLTLKDPRLYPALDDAGTAVARDKPRFRGEVTTTAPIAYGASPDEVRRALMALKPLAMAELAPGDIEVQGGPSRYLVLFSQHFAGLDVDLSVDGSGLQLPTPDAPGATAAVSDAVGAGGRKGRIDVLSDALIPHAYRGDPLHMHLIHVGIKETHPFHQHTNRWRQEPKDDHSTLLDVQSVGPGQTMDLEYDGGAGEAIASDPQNPQAGPHQMADWVRAGRPDLAALAVSHASNGDHIFHCHLYPHFAQGFWGALRVFDRQRPVDPAQWPAGMPHTYPDGTPLQSLALLPDFDLRGETPQGDAVSVTPLPDLLHPGYPLMLQGEYGQRAYRAPGAVVADRYGDPSLDWRRPGDTVRDYDSAATTDLERANMVTSTGADGRKHAVPGSFFIDPCPQGAPVREYHPTAIDADIVYNKAGWHDPGGKLYVEAPPSDPADPSTSIDTAARIRRKILAGTWQPEPYNMRSRLGECVNMRVTNATNLDNDTSLPLDVHDGQIDAQGNVTGHDAFHTPTLMSELSTHVHLVRFDELATDGTSVGWNYVQAPMVGQTWNYRWFVDMPLRTVYFHDHQNPNTHQQHGMWAAMNVEPQGSQWTDPRTGAWLAPSYCDALGLPAPSTRPDPTDPPCYGVGSVADVRVPDPAKPGAYAASFREFTVNYSDYVPLYDAAGKPVNGPPRPGDFSTDQGGMAINYRNEPFPTRVNSGSRGAAADPAYVFSSAVHGDPSTPLFRAYEGDPVIFRFMGGAHEEGHNFTLSGHRWLHEPDDPHSNLYDSQFVMISEFFNFEVSGTRTVKRGTSNDAVQRAREAGETEYGSSIILPGGAGAPGDYLYSSQPLNDLWDGMWGIFRVPAKRVPDLQPLPTNPAPPTGKPGQEWPALQPGQAIAPPRTVPSPCPQGAPQRTYRVSVVQQKIVYDSAGDNDPNGIAYVLDSDLDKTGRPKAGTDLKPLFIRADEGDCLSLVLTNRLPASGVTVGEGDPVNPVELVNGKGTPTVSNLVAGRPTAVAPTWPVGHRASLHLSGLVKQYTATSAGAAFGYDYDSTVAPGSSFTYRYFVDTRNIGVANMSDYGDLRGSRHHGAWGGLVVEPRGATFLRPSDLAPVPSGDQAVIRFVDAAGVAHSYREFVVDIQDGLNLFDKDGRPIQDGAPPDVVPAPGDIGVGVDPEDQGEVGVNYRSEPFRNRLRGGADIADVFSSSVFGDPATPVFRAYPNDPVMVRVLNSQDLPRVHTFGITGHSWRYEPNDPTSNIVTGQGGLDTSRAFNAGICAGSNTPLDYTTDAPVCGSDGRPGDYLYNDRNFFHMLSGGVWGLIRVHGTAQPDLAPLPDR